MAPLGTRAILFLAAAVSDFYLDDSFISEHKISSSCKESFSIYLSPVPKFIKLLKEELIPEAFIISFKLETDESKVLQKAQEALQRYGHDLVVANVLSSRKEKLWIVRKYEEVELILKREGPVEVELVRSLLQML